MPLNVTVTHTGRGKQQEAGKCCDPEDAEGNQTKPNKEKKKLPSIKGMIMVDVLLHTAGEAMKRQESS